MFVSDNIVLLWHFDSLFLHNVYVIDITNMMGGGNTEMTKVTFLKFYFICSFLAVSGLVAMRAFLRWQGGGATLHLWCGGFSLWWLPLLRSMGSGAHGLSSLWPPRLQSTGSTVVAHRLSCCAAWGILLDQGSNLCLLRWQENSFTTEPPGKS